MKDEKSATDDDQTEDALSEKGRQRRRSAQKVLNLHVEHTRNSLGALLPSYGESPNRIVTTEAGRDSFMGYYLPRTTSYLVYEYRCCGDQRRLVAAYTDRNGDKGAF